MHAWVSVAAVWAVALALAALAVPSAAASAAAAEAPIDWTPEERDRITAHGPWPPPPATDASNRGVGRPAVVAWGRALFHDPRLSADGRMACASCHQPARALQDGLATARQRDGAGFGVRNTPGLLDVGHRRWLGWGGEHDSVWAATLGALLAGPEMGQGVAALAARVRGTPGLRQGYLRAWGSAPPADDTALVVDVAKALAAWQATQVSPRTAFDAYRDALQRGDAAAQARYPAAAQRGLRLFIGPGRCATCHAGPAFSNGEFADIGRPFFTRDGVDPGRHAGLRRLQASPFNRLGRFNDAPAGTDPAAVLTQHLVIEPRHWGEFRVPGLRQLARTAPFFHDGSAPTLEAAVRHYSELNEDRLHADGERILRRLDLTPGQVADLVAFLESLSAPAPAAPPRPRPTPPAR